MRVLIFGDSIANGFYDSNGGWADRLRRYYLNQMVVDNNTDMPNVFNLGVSGDTTRNVLERFHDEVKARQWPDEDLLFVFAIGTNDTVYRDKEVQSTPETFRDELTTLLEAATKFSGKILFVSLFPVIDELLQPFPWSSSGKCYSTERMKLFNTTLEKFCADNGLPIVDLWSAFEEKADLKNLFFDGIHPNDTGHKIIFESVKAKLEDV